MFHVRVETNGEVVISWIFGVFDPLSAFDIFFICAVYCSIGYDCDDRMVMFCWFVFV